MSYSGRTLQALELAMNLHHDQKRKGTHIPYITHLWAVASIVGENGETIFLTSRRTCYLSGY